VTYTDVRRANSSSIRSTDRADGSLVPGSDHVVVSQPVPGRGQDLSPLSIPAQPDSAGSQIAELPFGASLEPALHKACSGNLSQVNWFRTEWQRSGALTGNSTYRDESGSARPVVVKLPVLPNELLWLDRLQPFDGLVPRLYAGGRELGGHDIAWVVMERIAHGPIGAAWGGAKFDLFVEAAGRFYEASSSFPVDRKPPVVDWQSIIRGSRDGATRGQLAHAQRWKQALKQADRRLQQWTTDWQQRPQNHWCHGDLHLANALSRHEAPQGPVVLIDFAAVHAGHWVEDAIYFEHLYWARGSALEGRKLCNLIARRRRHHGLEVDEHWPRFAALARALLAARVPGDLPLYGRDRGHQKAALEKLEDALALS
jgi:hypothetical protein